MFKLSLIVFALLLTINILAQSPHGDKLAIKCDVCHNADNWTKIKKDSYNHDKTGFPLSGQHKTVGCKKCHTDLVFSNAKAECNSCHFDVHQQTLGQDCERCHTTDSWMVQNIAAIHQQSGFPLVGQHAQTDCYQCHKSSSLLRFDPIKSECFDCHAKDYFATTNPSHVASKFPRDCSLCHNENDWKPSTFDHNTTAFPLKGGHTGVDCMQCHATGFTGTSTACVSCHLKDYNATTNPNHATAKFSTECLTCHNDKAWIPSTFDHNTNTSFPLTGGHIGVDCIKCHTAGYTGTSTACVSCHLKDYNVTTSPNHAVAKFSTECQTCHNSTTWIPSTFNHNSSTSFPLTGGHIGVDCIKCHTNGYTGTSTACVSCHIADYNTTTNPNHATAKFSTDCKTCHNVTAWQPSTFNHNTSTSFPLTGGHIGVDCIKCHTAGYTGTSTACVSCHLKDYNATINPAHAAAKFPKNCESCHKVTAWRPSTFNHDSQYFRIYSGKHRGAWAACSECHTNATNFSVFSCILCHEHNSKASVDSDHRGVSGYSYSGTSCFTCHARV